MKQNQAPRAYNVPRNGGERMARRAYEFTARRFGRLPEQLMQTASYKFFANEVEDAYTLSRLLNNFDPNDDNALPILGALTYVTDNAHALAEHARRTKPRYFFTRIDVPAHFNETALLLGALQIETDSRYDHLDGFGAADMKLPGAIYKERDVLRERGVDTNRLLSAIITVGHSEVNDEIWNDLPDLIDQGYIEEDEAIAAFRFADAAVQRAA